MEIKNQERIIFTKYSENLGNLDENLKKHADCATKSDLQENIRLNF